MQSFSIILLGIGLCMSTSLASPISGIPSCAQSGTDTVLGECGATATDATCLCATFPYGTWLDYTIDACNIFDVNNASCAVLSYCAGFNLSPIGLAGALTCPDIASISSINGADVTTWTYNADASDTVTGTTATTAQAAATTAETTATTTPTTASTLSTAASVLGSTNGAATATSVAASASPTTAKSGADVVRNVGNGSWLAMSVITFLVIVIL